MRGSQITEHTTDVGVVAAGRDFTDAVVSLAKRMVSVIVDPELVQSHRSWTVAVTSADR